MYLLTVARLVNKTSSYRSNDTHQVQRSHSADCAQRGWFWVSRVPAKVVRARNSCVDLRHTKAVCVRASRDLLQHKIATKASARISSGFHHISLVFTSRCLVIERLLVQQVLNHFEPSWMPCDWEHPVVLLSHAPPLSHTAIIVFKTCVQSDFVFCAVNRKRSSTYFSLPPTHPKLSQSWFWFRRARPNDQVGTLVRKTRIVARMQHSRGRSSQQWHWCSFIDHYDAFLCFPEETSRSCVLELLEFLLLPKLVTKFGFVYLCLRVQWCAFALMAGVPTRSRWTGWRYVEPNLDTSLAQCWNQWTIFTANGDSGPNGCLHVMWNNNQGKDWSSSNLCLQLAAKWTFRYTTNIASCCFDVSYFDSNYWHSSHLKGKFQEKRNIHHRLLSWAEC